MPYKLKILPSDWILIKARYQNGESAHQIQKDFPIARQTIDEKADKEGWKEQSSTKAWLDLIKVKAKHSYGDQSPATLANILDLVRYGMSPQAAGEMCGLTKRTITKWRNEDCNFDTLLIAAGREFHFEKLAIINRSNEWQAANKALEKNWITKEEYQDKANVNTGTIKVELSFSRGDNFEQPEIIDVDVTEVEVQQLPKE